MYLDGNTHLICTLGPQRHPVKQASPSYGEAGHSCLVFQALCLKAQLWVAEEP